MNRRQLLAMLPGLAAACRQRDDGRAPTEKNPADFVLGKGGPDLDHGQKSPPLPPDLPIWEWSAEGFVADARWYGEHDWDGVRMRLLGHLAFVGRDRARAAARRGDGDGVRAALAGLGADLDAARPRQPGVASELHRVLVEMVARDEALVALWQARSVDRGRLSSAGRVLAGADASSLSAVPSALDLDAFADFDERHTLRVAQWAAWADVADPLGLAPWWGYFGAGAWRHHVTSLLDRARAGQWVATSLPAALEPDSAELGALPTGDSLIDTAGGPGPRAIGSLWMMGADDRPYQAWLKTQARAWSTGGLAEVKASVAAVAAHTHGSRFYNAKQLRNAGVRMLAGRQDWAGALSLVADQRPLHHQDWACPNRDGILRILEGRLRLCSQDGDAEAVVDDARARSLAFLDQVAKAERGEPVGVRPPPMGAPGVSGQRPGARGPTTGTAAPGHRAGSHPGRPEGRHPAAPRPRER